MLNSMDWPKALTVAAARVEAAKNEELAALQHAQALDSDDAPQQYRQQATSDYLLAKSRRETAEARESAVVYFIMAQLRVSPDEYLVQPTPAGFTLVKRKN